jgi:hypothetical protein
VRLPATFGEVADATTRIGRDGLIARALVAGSTAACWAVMGAVGGLSWIPSLIVAIVCVAAVAGPDSGAPFALIVVLIGAWMIQVRPMSLGWSIVLALSVLVIHAASARAAALGEGATLDGRVVRRWLAQTGVVALTTTALWGLMVLIDDAGVTGGVVVSAAAIAAVAAFAVLVGWLAISGRSG